ncbi:proline--tRNA ligase [Spirochaeta africana]|uniref:Proline--tRNA ligase n=1 Tax=Spirochaeta africana (strain ATCC 700263 / DSM 8902 / Z-7692) TaxID=889378 RepID=H9UGX8_SPIAZ|nr:proline--tRNA ligase [Spirochaeta africana]AFG36771.1 prolyl-tRNA synthetase, family II [Spirochaeta africana DSM 8902]
MRYSRLFTRTMRHTPREVQAPSHQLLLRGGYIRQIGHGLFGYLPLGQRVVQNIKRLIRAEMERLEGNEISVPLVNPREIWESSGRIELVGRDLVQFSDAAGRGLVLAPTHEEAVVEMVRSSLTSYRDLPLFVYQFQQKYRDERRARHGLLRLHEFLMKDGYSFHRNFSDLNNFFPRVFAAYERIFRACGLNVVPVEAGVGFMGGERAYEFHVASPIGDDVIIRCEGCGYTANREVAVGHKPSYGGTPRPMETVDTPGCDSMQKLSRYLDLPRHSLAKSMMFRTARHLVMAVVRADFQVSVEKLRQASGEAILGMARPADLRSAGLVPGYFSPIGLEQELIVVVDDAVANTPNLVFGANEPERHHININFGRDYEACRVADISRITRRHSCQHCGGELHEQSTVELGNIFRLGTFYSERMGLEIQEEHSKRVYPYMGSYGIGIDRLLAAVVEQYHDRRGIAWPFELAPYPGYLISLGRSLRVREFTEMLHRELGDLVLYDDRGDSISSKMKDAELLGIPYILVVSPDSIASGMVEVIERSGGGSKKIPPAQLEEILTSKDGFRNAV